MCVYLGEQTHGTSIRRNLKIFWNGELYVETTSPQVDSLSVNWCFEPSQPLGIISGLRETIIDIYILERTNKAELRQQKQSEKTKSCRENLWNEIQLKGP